MYWVLACNSTSMHKQAHSSGLEYRTSGVGESIPPQGVRTVNVAPAHVKDIDREDVSATVSALCRLPYSSLLKYFCCKLDARAHS